MPAAWVGAAAALYSATQSGGGGGGYSGGYGGGNFLYLPSGEPSADVGWQNQVGQQAGLLNSYYGAVPGYAQSAFNTQFYNPYGDNLIRSAQQGGQMAGAAAPNLFGAGNQIYGTAFDPQGALYDRMFQQERDQTAANQYMRGTTMSPYGAGIANQADINFNIDWQNAQLQRQLSGAQAIPGLYSAGVGEMMQSGALPYQAQNTLGQGQNAAIQNYTGQFSPIFQQQGNLMNQYLAYMGLAGGAQQNQLSAAQNQRDFNAQQAQLLGQSVGQGVSNYMNSPYYGNNQYYASDGTFTPAYSGYDSSGGPAYG